LSQAELSGARDVSVRPTFCETVTSYCERLVSDVGGSAGHRGP
jgi:hypothetical protein